MNLIMNLDKISVGSNPPYEVNVIIEVSQGSSPIKYELNKEFGLIEVDRFMPTSMTYPCNYGFIPNTLSEDQDPIDVLVICEFPIVPNALIKVRPIGVLMMEDESGIDEKILAVPISKLTSLYDKIVSYHDLPEMITLRIAHFFEYYKKLEQKKWVKINGWQDENTAYELINKSIERENASK